MTAVGANTVVGPSRLRTIPVSRNELHCRSVRKVQAVARSPAVRTSAPCRSSSRTGALVPAGAWPAAEPPVKNVDEKAPELAPPTARELFDKRTAFVKTALSNFTIRAGARKDEAGVAGP